MRKILAEWRKYLAEDAPLSTVGMLVTMVSCGTPAPASAVEGGGGDFQSRRARLGNVFAPSALTVHLPIFDRKMAKHFICGHLNAKQTSPSPSPALAPAFDVFSRCFRVYCHDYPILIPKSFKVFSFSAVDKLAKLAGKLKLTF